MLVKMSNLYEKIKINIIELYDFSKHTPLYIILIYIIVFVFDFCKSNIMTNNFENPLMLYAIVSIIKTIIEYFTNITCEKYTYVKMKDYERKYFERYNNLDNESKNKSDIFDFTEKLNNAKGVYMYLYIDGCRTIINLIACVCSFCYVIIVNNQILIFVLLIIVHSLCYFYITKIINEKRNEKKKLIQNEKDNIKDKLKLLYVRMHNNEANLETILAEKENVDILRRQQSNLWYLLYMIQEMPNFILILIISLFVNKNLYLILYIICNNMTSSINNFLNFYNQKLHIDETLNELEKFFDNKTFIKNIHKSLDIPNNLILNCDNSILHVNNKDKILISGISGSGKTTFIEKLIGNVDGLTNNFGTHQQSYNHQIRYMSQTEKKLMPFNSSTIRELFYNEINNNLIYKALETVELHNPWFYNSMENNMDTKIKGKISEGERTRLYLAINLYKAKKDNVKWLILDEPDSGVDIETSPTIVKNILDNFSNITLFLVVHMCKCKIEQFNFTKIWSVDNKKITEKYKNTLLNFDNV
jgi:ABC-type transport system involved in cytochrome bd biosynthesis fused ATPase/permease subunit